jgi:hypothetical protein
MNFSKYHKKKNMKKGKCEVCKKEAKDSQFSPDYGGLYFCSLRHHREYSSKYLYRACPFQDIKTHKEVDENKVWDLVACPCCGSKVKKSNLCKTRNKV